MTAGATTPRNRSRAPRHWSLVLPHAPLPEALAICLDMVGSKRYERAAISWHTRFCAYAADLTFSDAHAVMTALAALPGSDKDIAATQLALLSRRYGLGEVAEVVEGWAASQAIRGRTEKTAGARRRTRLIATRGHHPTTA